MLRCRRLRRSLLASVVRREGFYLRDFQVEWLGHGSFERNVFAVSPFDGLRGAPPSRATPRSPHSGRSGSMPGTKALSGDISGCAERAPIQRPHEAPRFGSYNRLVSQLRDSGGRRRPNFRYGCSFRRCPDRSVTDSASVCAGLNAPRALRAYARILVMRPRSHDTVEFAFRAAASLAPEETRLRFIGERFLARSRNPVIWINC